MTPKVGACKKIECCNTSNLSVGGGGGGGEECSYRNLLVVYKIVS